MLDKLNISIIMTSLLYFYILLFNITSIFIFIINISFFVQSFGQSYLEVSVEKFPTERNSVREHLDWHQTHGLPVHQEPGQWKYKMRCEKAELRSDLSISGLGRWWLEHIHMTQSQTSALLQCRGSAGKSGFSIWSWRIFSFSPRPPPMLYISTSSSV